VPNVGKKDEYRRFAAASLDSAKRAPEGAEKTRRLVMAEVWLELADRTSQMAKTQVRRLGDHPLVRRMLARNPTDAE
jgi:hypothetical protein